MANRFKMTAIIIILLSLILKLSGFIRESIIADEFGASHITDGYILAFTLITLVLTIISTGFNNVFLPLYTKNKKTNLAQTTRDASTLMNGTVLLFILLSIASYFFIPILAPLIFGFMDEKTREVAIGISKFFSVFLPFLALNGILESYLQAHYSYVPAHAAKLSATLLSALSGLIFSDLWGIYSLAYGFVAGLILGVGIQSYYLFKKGFTWTPALKLSGHFKQAFVVLLVPSLLNAIVGPLNTFADKIFASTTIGGAVTYLNNASLIVSIPNAIYATTIGALIFTFLTERTEEKQGFYRILKTGIELNFMVFIPLTAGLMVVGNEAIAFIYQHGHFTDQDTLKTYEALLMYAPLIITQGMQVIVSKAMYALERTAIILRISLTTIILNLALNYLFMIWFGFLGLALSSSLVSIYFLVISTRFLYKELADYPAKRLFLLLGKVIPPTLCMVIPMLLLKRSPILNLADELQQIISLTVIGVLFYLLGMWLFYRSGLKMLYRMLIKREKGFFD
ncbi:putative peptidoglycan lipid II flippase [Scopulibacillus darangshiensis]|uniref:Putative peptidoglycan lipid II flippase n=1 Tax=Scopulibacillus darangshiensis TaxID=442528 RepID=A0A4R2NV92_9BACL|nr:lipid II flippase MurJ [Scopulibacillus darangshiensis]TCP26009.1 putative peptidoglycan lipid II flippase [Scopulibacillus darangshiensis]